MPCNDDPCPVDCVMSDWVISGFNGFDTFSDGFGTISDGFGSFSDRFGRAFGRTFARAFGRTSGRRPCRQRRKKKTRGVWGAAAPRLNPSRGGVWRGFAPPAKIRGVWGAAPPSQFFQKFSKIFVKFFNGTLRKFSVDIFQERP